MAAYTSTKTGNWSDATVWGGTVPGNGDTVSFGHDITVDVDTIIGASNGQWVSAGNPAAMQRTTNGSLTVAAGKTLTVRGDYIDAWSFASAMNPAKALLRLKAGARYRFDSSTTSPTTTPYRIHVTANFRFNSLTACEGTSGARCRIDSVPGGANGSFTQEGATNGHGYIATFTDFVDLGSATVQSLLFSPATGSGTAQPYVDMQDCVFTRCGFFRTIGMATHSHFRWLRVKFIDSLGDTCGGPVAAAAPTTGERYVKYCVFDKVFGTLPTSSSMPGFLLEQVFWEKGHSISASSAAIMAGQEWRKCLQRKPVLGDVVTPPLVSGGALWYDGEIDNAHIYSLNANFDVTLRDVVMDWTGELPSGALADSLGDWIISPPVNPSAVRNYLVERNIYTGTALDTTLMNWTWFSSRANIRVTANHNTIHTFIISAGEPATGVVEQGTILSLKSNICYDTAFARPCWIDQRLNIGGLLIDRASPDALDYNCFHGYTAVHTGDFAGEATNQGKGYAGKWSVTPGAHDLPLNTDPQFKDRFRTIARFDIDVLGVAVAPNWADGQAYAVGDIRSHVTAWYQGRRLNLRCIQAHTSNAVDNEPLRGRASPGGSNNWRNYWEFNSVNEFRNRVPTAATYSGFGVENGTIIDLYCAWIRDGMAPTNQLLKNAGHDGTDIGAVAVFTPPAPSATTARESTLSVGILVGV